MPNQGDTQEPTGELMSYVWRISGDEGKKARPGQARALSSSLRSPWIWLSIIFSPLQLPGAQLGLLQRGTDTESALHHSPPSKVAWWEPGDKKWELTSMGQENRRLPSACVDKLYCEAFSPQRSSIDGFPKASFPRPTA